MNRLGAILTSAGLFGISLAIPACSAAPSDVSASSQGGGLGQTAVAVAHAAVCPTIRGPGGARCMSHIQVDASGKPLVTSAPSSGYGPHQIQSAYEIPAPAAGVAPTVALVDAYDTPSAESDLATYRSYFGLPPCTTANGCFKKVNQDGVAGSYPSSDPQGEWGGETSLDLDAVSAACPACKIILVETNSGDLSDLGTGVNAAVALGANAVSNSYGGSEDPTNAESSTDYYDHPGVLIAASSGDGAYGVAFPASSQYVLGVGGTSLSTASNARGWSESVWYTQPGEGGGSGCSSYTPKPSWQTDTGCPFKTVADVSAVADPNTGLAVYYSQDGGWTVIGGTSLASPLVAAIFAATGRASGGPSFPYKNTADFWDVTSGANGSCSPAYLCTAQVGYDGPTGIGTPNGAAMSGGSAGSDAGAGTSDAGASSDAGGGGRPDAGGGTPVDAGGGTGSPDAGPAPDDAGGGGTTTGAPAITLVSPTSGSTVDGNDTISLVANVTSSVGLSSVVLQWIEPAGTVTVDCASPPAGTACAHNAAGVYTWSFTASTGTRSWSVIATDQNGNSTTSAANSLTLVTTNAPVVTFLEPAAGAGYPPGGTVPVVVQASGPNGVSQVWLTWSGPAGDSQLQLSYLGSNEWGLNVPFSSAATAGTRTLTVTAYDPSDIAASAETTITVE